MSFFFLVIFQKMNPIQIDLSPETPRIFNFTKIVGAVSDIQIIYTSIARLKALVSRMYSNLIDEILIFKYRPEPQLIWFK